MNQVGDFMTKKAICVSSDTPLTKAAQILFADRFNGLPVVDKDNKVIGILTEYDLLTKGTSIHLPTFVKLLAEFDLYKKDKSLIKDELAGILSMRVADVMNHEPLVLPSTTTIEEITKAFAEHHRVNPIPIVDENKRLVGIVSRHDLLRWYAHGASRSFRLVEPERKLDNRINNFLSSFEDEFVLVSKFRTRFWFIFSILFTIVGFVIAMAFILRVSLK